MNREQGAGMKKDFANNAEGIFSFILREMKPRGKMFTTFNVISVPTILLGMIILVIRFTKGLGAVTNLSQDFPWGFWIGFDVVTGVAFAAGAYIITFVVYVMRVEQYHSLVRVTVLNGLLAYVFYAGALVLDLGRPWNIINPIIGNSFGYNSVLFLVSWHFMLYMMAEFIEFSPAIAEWLGLKNVRRFLEILTVGAVIFGITLSMLHQSGLGALYLLAKSKIHPLWYSEFIPVLFFVSSIFAGISMIIFEGTISHRVFKDRMDAKHHGDFDKMILGLSKGASIALFTYFFFKVLIFVHGKHWTMMKDFWGAWYLVEVIGFVLIPCFLYAYGTRNKNLGVIRVAAIWTMIGIILNRMNISVIAFNWTAPVRYYPSWMEIVVTLMVIFLEIWVFRWIVTRMPVFGESHESAVAS
jgi:Ni/Fe-hydrogenase subunit HybB-like protein